MVYFRYNTDEFSATDGLLQSTAREQKNSFSADRLGTPEKYGVRIILNPAPIREISDKTAQSVFLVTPNEQEKQAIDSQRFQNCVTTLGGDGCMINEKIKIPPILVKPIDTTGAGDTFNGVLAVCIAEGMDIKTACEYAVAASGISVGKKYVLNAIPRRSEIENKMRGR